MTRDSGIMSIFYQNWSFSNVLVVWRAKVQALVVRWAIRKTTGSLGGLNCNFPIKKSELAWFPQTCRSFIVLVCSIVIAMVFMFFLMLILWCYKILFLTSPVYSEVIGNTGRKLLDQEAEDLALKGPCKMLWYMQCLQKILEKRSAINKSFHILLVKNLS